jgi:hypothetical protein
MSVFKTNPSEAWRVLLLHSYHEKSLPETSPIQQLQTSFYFEVKAGPPRGSRVGTVSGDFLFEFLGGPLREI